MKHTGHLKAKILELWTAFENGEISAVEGRVHIGMARTIIETVKVELAASRPNVIEVPTVPLNIVEINDRRKTQ
jgi:hypothetical protein